MNEWISVKDRLPEGDTACIVYFADRGTVMVTHYFDDFALVRVNGFEGFTEHGVTHWMPLPEPPEQGKGG